MAVDPESLLVSLVAGGFSGTITAIVGYYTVSRKIEKETRAKVDLDLRTRRIDAYRELWYLTRAFSETRVNSEYEKKTTGKLVASLSKWYFEEGGIFLSETSQKALGLSPNVAIKKLDSSIYLQLRNDASNLRTCTARDIGTREEWKSDYGTESVKKVNSRLDKLGVRDKEANRYDTPKI